MRAEGSSLLEVMLALLLLMLGGLGTVHLLGLAQGYIVEARSQQQALFLAEDKLEQLQALPPEAGACASGLPLPSAAGEERLNLGDDVYHLSWQRTGLCNPTRWQLSVRVRREGGATDAGVSLDAEHFSLRVQ